MPPRVIADRAYQPMVVDSHPGIKHRYDEKIASVIFALSSGGVPSPAIIYTVGLTWPTILKFYREALHAGRAMAEKKIAEKMFTLALKAESEQVQFQASKFWLSARAGWKETSAVEFNSTGDGNVPQINENMTEEEAAAAYASMRKSQDSELIEGELVEDDEPVDQDELPLVPTDLMPSPEVIEPSVVEIDKPDPWAGFVDG